jgi:orotidine-5'-phosphate decarboxylase
MYVVGATRPEYFKKIRNIIPDNFLLVPGVGAQGGSLQDVCKYGLNDEIGLLINSSRGIIYASSDKDFAASAREKSKELQKEMSTILFEKGL